ncbi:hypothetical protein BURPS668_A2816 [Burkholderia pseudomallei 668]|nr:hypothetical protein BURPS668_A2816 [Burkholderia pseudomallei 668]
MLRDVAGCRVMRPDMTRCDLTWLRAALPGAATMPIRRRTT